MGISLKGHDSNFQYWVFDIDGRDWIAVNQSTQNPLKIQFQGRYGNWGTGNPLSKAAGFDIISSTVSKTGPDGEKQGVVEWVWNGTRYKSAWGLYPGTEIIAGDPAEGIEAVWDYQLAFTTGIAYDGPAGGAVGTGVTSQATIVAAKTKDEREAIEAATTQISPSAQLSTAAPEQASPAPAKPVTAGVVSTAVIAQSNKTKEDIEASTAYKTPGYVQPVYASQVRQPATYTPASTGMTRMTGMTTSPVIIPGTKDAREAAADAAAAAGTDWVKLGLQIGAAYLLFS